ncbi:hypothetical protein [Deinococcus radiophilus]|uniref:Right handed beta helix domain-containing protein n=1 Tax=Deinococcus radiophilus TaxID=32062 RepID=A0A431VFD1_9DEIO|nr:hypothetical protein [Deinococcus radiophilus]RTR17902.1 hypothetical protein EJ104_13730 [Deinococcus radiophilus]UFA50959.1 hypothetical protein LMT64_03410 [Deinococcus radiophilus]
MTADIGILVTAGMKYKRLIIEDNIIEGGSSGINVTIGSTGGVAHIEEVIIRNNTVGHGSSINGIALTAPADASVKLIMHDNRVARNITLAGTINRLGRATDYNFAAVQG